MSAKISRNPWAWVPTLYVAEGLPYAMAMTVALIFYKNLGVSNQTITYATGWLYLPWVIKPLWSPAVNLVRTRRWWIWTMQLVVGGVLGAMAFAIPTAHFFQLTLGLFWLLAFASATHDVAADGFYLLALHEHGQAMFNGVRTTCYRLAGIFAKGLLVMFVGNLIDRTRNGSLAWSVAFGLVSAIVLLLGMYHRGILPHPIQDRPAASGGNFAGEFWHTLAEFFKKPGIGIALLFLLFYRLGEAQLMPITQLFLLDPRSSGGLGLTDAQIGFISNTVGVAAMICGGLLGGWVISRKGLKFWLWPMLLAIHLPDAVFVWLAMAQPGNLWAVGAGIAVEQFGYGFGFAAYMLYMIYIARGVHSTAHYALCTGFMAAGMMIPALWSGWLQTHLGYPLFFMWVLLATIPSFVVAANLKLEPDFGMRKELI